MRKIKLQLESLAVESFDTTQQEPADGTVAGHQLGTRYTCASCEDSCIQTACTCIETCGGSTCEGTCDWTCSCFCTMERTFCVACDPYTSLTCTLPCA